MNYKCTYISPLGEYTLFGNKGRLLGLWLKGQKYFGENYNVENALTDSHCFREVINWLDRYFAGEKPDIFELSLAPSGSSFRQEVWEILKQIPYGQTTSYAEISAQIAQRKKIDKMASQAVGNAVGHNPISIIIPCHRVVGKDGSLRGYAGGIDTKIELLKHEGVDTRRFFAG